MCHIFKKLNGSNIANRILETVEVNLGLDMRLCRVMISDRASTNKKALNDLKNEDYLVELSENGDSLKLQNSWCVSHTLSNDGKRMYESNNAENTGLFCDSLFSSYRTEQETICVKRVRDEICVA